MQQCSEHHTRPLGAAAQDSPTTNSLQFWSPTVARAYSCAGLTWRRVNSTVSPRVASLTRFWTLPPIRKACANMAREGLLIVWAAPLTYVFCVASSSTMCFFPHRSRFHVISSGWVWHVPSRPRAIITTIFIYLIQWYTTLMRIRGKKFRFEVFWAQSIFTKKPCQHYT
jgi:hypothetical protein